MNRKAANSAYIDWKYLNNTKTLPGGPVTSGTVTFTLPVATGHKYELRHIRAGTLIDYATVNPTSDRVFYWDVWAKIEIEQRNSKFTLPESDISAV